MTKAQIRKYAKSVIESSTPKGSDIVRSWRDNFIKESNGVPLLLIVGGKVLYADQILTNIAYAVEQSEKTTRRPR